ncbi:MAG: carbohydrate binding domain-containing protein [Planctomycetes bacterium]|nr:carbohydrate binding domain-containing protein [Planctomycetota bacterium]
MNLTVIAVAVVQVWTVASSAIAAPGNLASNPGLEVVSQGPLSDGWEPLSIGAPARFVVDEQIRHTGRRSIRIDADEVTRSYARSAAIAVAPGETVEISAWVRTRDVPQGQGTVILIAESTRGRERGEVSKVGVAAASADWQQIKGRLTVPESADTLRLRMGFSYSKGTCWWDDVEVRAAAPVVARHDSPEGRLYPAGQAIPVTILNRDGHRRSVRVTVQLDDQAFTHTCSLTGEPAQRVEIPARIVRCGKHDLRIELRDEGANEPLWSSGATPVVVPPPLVLSPPIPTHWVIEDGLPQVELDVDLALDGPERVRRPLIIEVRTTEGRSLHFQEQPLSATGPTGSVTIRLRPDVVPEGSYQIVVTVPADGGSPIAAEQPWGIIPRRAAEVRLNTDGHPVRNGRAIFPLGMFNNEGKLKEEVEAGFNIIHFYNAARVKPGRRPDDQRLADAMNRCHAAGMNVLLLVPMEYTFVGDWDAFTRRIRMFRNHPALLAWDEEEGLARGDMTMDMLRRVRQILRAEDPHHPFMVGDARDVIGRITDRGRMFPTDQMDLGMWWWYPFPLKNRPGDALQGEQAGSGLTLNPPTFLTEANASKPIWLGVQAYKKPGPEGRYPTPVEHRAQAYLGIIHGARGLMWYGGSVTGGTFLAPDAAHWPELKKLVGEVSYLSAVLLAPAEPPPATTPADAPISAGIRRSADRRVLFAVNRGPTACDVAFTIANLPDGSVHPIGEDRTVSVSTGQLRDRFDPYATHVYDLGR